ncbi:HAD family hydrolase [Gracilibacillus sp. S3-1-1]|uniref:HAD family hydrolase n=1 Tax=Gracilibacillus pellucidus TaxID=3095368 RepID=A0ACC6M2N8_9BACI|nr:HAD family hydrolase [Gracilibacillus sp. S3-1-1]MDX8045140.1 HAD family hydrolase [Gracilibacillus sp. S3-1-1]
MTFLPKALCLDMDGTLLNNHNQLTENTLTIIQYIRQQGVRVFIVTGRSLNEVFDSAPADIELDGFVTANGMITYLDGEKLLEHSLSTTLVEKVIQSAREHNIYYEAHPNDGDRLSLLEDKPYMEKMISGNKPDQVGINEWLEREDAINHDIKWYEQLPEQKYAKMYCFSSEQTEMKNWIECLEELKKETDFTTSSSSHHNVEVMVSGVNKATGIKALLNHYGISPEQTMAMGDSNNDIPMMKYVGYPVGMRNATDQIKELVTDTTTYTNDEEGVYHFLKNYFQAEV